MKPYFETELGRLWLGKCENGLEHIKTVDFVFADPPYGIGKAKWDKKYPSGFEKTIINISRKGVAITPGQINIGTCIINLGEHNKGILSRLSFLYIHQSIHFENINNNHHTNKILQ